MLRERLTAAVAEWLAEVSHKPAGGRGASFDEFLVNAKNDSRSCASRARSTLPGICLSASATPGSEGY